MVQPTQQTPQFFGPIFLGLQGAHIPRGGNEPPLIGTTFVRGGQLHTIKMLTPTLVNESRGLALGSLVLAPLWISVRAIVSIAVSLANILTLGSFSVRKAYVENTLKGRLKAMGCSALSLLTTPANVAVEGLATISHVLKPEINKIDLLAAHMWTGFVRASLPIKPIPR